MKQPNSAPEAGRLRYALASPGEPGTIERPAANPAEETREELREDAVDDTSGAYRVILYDDDWHGFDEVIVQVQKATGCNIYKATAIMLEAHTKGRAVCYRGTREQCQRVARVLREIRLQVEVDCD